MKKVVLAILVLAVIGAGVWYAFGGEKKSASFGQGAQATVTPISTIMQNPTKYLGQVVTVEGMLTKECPGSGCWWYVMDETGEIRADSLGSDFTLPLHQETKKIRTTGKLIKTDDGELQLLATGAVLK